MALWTAKLEFAPATLATASPPWFNVSEDLIEAEWFSGKANDLDEPAPGGATFRLANPGRKYEPEYAGGLFYPNIDTERRFRLTLTDASGAVQQGVFYVESWNVEYPAGTRYSEVVVQCVDGFGLLAADALPALDPPDAETYSDVIEYDEPSFYYRFGEPEGTKLVTHVRKRKRKRKGKVHITRHRWRTRETRAEVEGISGPAGTYKNTPTLGEPGFILGDPDTCVRFTSSRNEYARIGPLDDSDLIDRNQLTVECWVKHATLGAQVYVAGPNKASTGDSVFYLWANSADLTGYVFLTSAGGLTGAHGLNAPGVLSAGNVYHVAMVWKPNDLILYLNGAEVARSTDPLAPRTLAKGDVGEYLYFGRATAQYLNGWLDEAAIYEKPLPLARIQARYLAGTARGYPQQLTGARIADAATSPLWSTAGVEAGSFQLQPLMKFGQAPLDVILEAVQSERPKALFYFDGSGNPIFRDFDFLDGVALAETFGDAPGETRYTDVALIYDNEIYNQVTGSRDGGEAITVSNTQSITDRKLRARSDESGMPLADDADVSAIVNTILSEWATPTLRPATVSLVGGDADRTSNLLRRKIGERVRVRRRGEGGVPIDRQSVILGYRKSFGRDRVLEGTFNLSRGFNAATSGWRLGSPGFSELGTTTRLG